MKTFQLLALCASTLFPIVALATDNISVTVNGQTYTCSGSGSGGEGSYKFYCKCEYPNSSWYSLNYHRLNRITGEDTVVRTVAQIFSQDSCEKELRVNPVCKD